MIRNNKTGIYTTKTKQEITEITNNTEMTQNKVVKLTHALLQERGQGNESVM